MGLEGGTGYFRRMLNERFLGLSTTLPSRASHPMAQSSVYAYISCLLRSWDRRSAATGGIHHGERSPEGELLPVAQDYFPRNCEWAK